jgi:ferric-dicitrate binding protein FerR (iron transport regulator)
MDKNAFKALYQRYLEDDLTPDELQQWRQAAADPAMAEQVAALLGDTISEELPYAEPEPVNLEHIRHYLMTSVVGQPAATRSRVLQLRRWIAVAAVLLIVAATAWLLVSRKSATRQQVSIVKDIGPGHAGAVLTLSDGRKMVLDSLSDGQIANENGSTLVLHNNQLQYNATAAGQGIAMNTLTTPPGRQFQLSLSDGSRVWLNAASSIQFPAQFNEKERRVAVTGEVYIEVAQNKNQPFYVSSGQSEIQVLGTAFNLNAYNNEPAEKTTLISGKIAVKNLTAPGSGLTFLLPGQQAIAARNRPLTLHTSVDLGYVLAWKNGIFNFEGADIQTIMREVARWYNVTVVFEGPVSKEEFGGAMDRNITLQQLLKALSDWHIEYRLEGSTLTIIGHSS